MERDRSAEHAHNFRMSIRAVEIEIEGLEHRLSVAQAKLARIREQQAGLDRMEDGGVTREAPKRKKATRKAGMRTRSPEEDTEE